jgi:CheY-like chemotaxis protein
MPSIRAVLGGAIGVLGVSGTVRSRLSHSLPCAGVWDVGTAEFNVHFCTFMRNKRPLATFGHGTFAGWEEVADLPIVLIVEDDESIQSIVEDALMEGGFETAIAPSAEEAVTLLKGKVMDYRALVTDINLKGRMTGWEVAKQARQIEPEFPIVYITGAAADDWASHGVPNSILLVKPFAPAQLVTAVSQLLNKGAPTIEG